MHIMLCAEVWVKLNVNLNHQPLTLKHTVHVAAVKEIYEVLLCFSRIFTGICVFTVECLFPKLGIVFTAELEIKSAVHRRIAAKIDNRVLKMEKFCPSNDCLVVNTAAAVRFLIRVAFKSLLLYLK